MTTAPKSWNIILKIMEVIAESKGNSLNQFRCALCCSIRSVCLFSVLSFQVIRFSRMEICHFTSCLLFFPHSNTTFVVAQDVCNVTQDVCIVTLWALLCRSRGALGHQWSVALLAFEVGHPQWEKLHTRHWRSPRRQSDICCYAALPHNVFLRMRPPPSMTRRWAYHQQVGLLLEVPEAIHHNWRQRLQNGRFRHQLPQRQLHQNMRMQMPQRQETVVAKKRRKRGSGRRRDGHQFQASI